MVWQDTHDVEPIEIHDRHFFRGDHRDFIARRDTKSRDRGTHGAFRTTRCGGDRARRR